MSRTIQEILAELEANRDEARAQRKAAAEKLAEAETAIRDAIEAQEAALEKGNQEAYDQATKDRAFHEAAAKRIKELPLYYTPEQLVAYQRDGVDAHLMIKKKFAKQIAPLIDQIQQLEKEAMEEISSVKHIAPLVQETLSDDFSTDWPYLPVDYRVNIPFFAKIEFPKIPYEFYYRIFKLAGRE